MRGGPTAIAALVSGNVDFASIGGAQAAIRSKARGLDLQHPRLVIELHELHLDRQQRHQTASKTCAARSSASPAPAPSPISPLGIYLKRNNLDPDKDVTLRAIGETVLRAIALEKGVISAAPFSAEDTVKLLDKGFPMIVNLNEALRVPQSVHVTRGEMLEKSPETTKRFLKAMILGMQFAKYNKQEAIKIGFASRLAGRTGYR